ncbi:MAG: rhodanese-like domain-containing protein [Desulfuromonadales bacterium]
MKKQFSLAFITLFVALFVSSAPALATQYISAAEVKQMIEENKAMVLVDIQPEEEFNRHHIVGAVPTYAFPAKSKADRLKLAPLAKKLRDTDETIVVVCPRGGGGAKNTYSYLLESGIAEGRLFILTQGQAGWPYPELLEQNQ